jgi:DNA-binding CsgD family transcriptional regulator
MIVSDNGTELTSNAVLAWRGEIGMEALHRARQADAERLCRALLRRMRDQLLNETLFLSLAHARVEIAAWMADYNQARPHSSLGYATPAAFAAELDRQSASRPIHLVGGRIAPRDGMQARNLAAAIAAAACPHSPSAGFVEPSSIDGRRTIVAIAPLVETAGRTALLLCQPGVSDGLRFGLRKLFCLTAAEADVAALLAEGLDLAQISKSRRVSLATIRTQVKAVASRMGCQRQAEVVAVVKGVPALANDAFEADPEFVQA